ncbi:YadA C-terminal domain-containing protein [Megasphaera stantonii]|uniref:YadA C-terminal domain-containing protein n=1 Tax=Megasphaera stantonii TaxID=2144175 RepID=UPI0023F1AC98|nr:S-layer homology domain-containing protein [Megasphaera stantonii]
MKMSEKARSMAAVLAVMTLTTGFSGVQAEQVSVMHDHIFGTDHKVPGYYVDSDKMGAALGIDGMKGDLEDVKKQASELKDVTGQHASNIESLQGKVEEQEIDIMKAQAAADTAQATADINTGKITELQGQVDTNTGNIESLQGKVGEQEIDIMKAQAAADTAQATADINTGKITELQGTVATNSQEIDTLHTNVNNINNTVQQHTQDIGKVQTIVGDGVLSNTNASNLTEAVNQNYAQINNNTQAISALDSRVDDLGGEIDQVGAISAALAGLHPLDYDGTGSKFQLSAAMGSYDSTQAAAIGAFYHFNRDVMISLGGATSFDGDHKTAGNLGVTFRIGEGASGKSVSDDVMARLEAMDQKIAALEQENKNLKNVLGAIDTSLSKEFPDVPANHWAYEAVTKLAGNDVVAGYPDGEFHGDRTMTRYEMAEVIYKAMSKGVQVDQKLVEEFKPEMEQVAANQNA